MDTLYDYAIVGGGCSGLSLTVELMNAVSNGERVAIIEPRLAYTMDRIWCFWKTTPHRFTSAIQHEWNRWRVRCNGREVVQVSKRFPYQYVPADAFYTSAFDVIRRFPSVDLLLGTRVTAFEEKQDAVHIRTDKDALRARVVFDGRNSPRDHVGRPYLAQHYLGQRIRTSRPVFTPDTLTLMDFDVTQRHGIAFVYLLPFSDTEALVEPTVFSRSPLDTEVYISWIRRYLLERYGIEDYQVLFQEKGIIPMSADGASPVQDGRIVPIGTAAGAVKGSTGYGFLAIQEWNRSVVDAVVRNRSGALKRPRTPLSDGMDRIFLSFLETHPGRAPDVFFDLFRRVPADRLVRFLSDRATARDVGAVVMSMPKAPFLQEALRVMTKRWWGCHGC